MNMLLNLESPVTTAHRAKLAYIYVRQSTAGQVRQHQESTELQYRLVDRAALFGWPKERIEVIDDDLGKSGTSSDSRGGFQRLIAEIGLGKAGLVLSLDASRLARNNRDWHQLLELCSLFGVILADGERLYDPGAYHDRLLLGLSGIMSEAELHQIRLRLHQGERQKAARGELRVPLPAGLAYDPGYHRAEDNLDNVDLVAFDRNLSAFAWAVGTFAGDDPGRYAFPRLSGQTTTNSATEE